MPDDPDEMTLAQAEEVLRTDGRFEWLLSGRQAWSVAEIAERFAQSYGVPVSHDTVTRWVKRLPSGGVDNFGGTIGYRARRDALIQFFAAGKHLKGGD